MEEVSLANLFSEDFMRKLILLSFSSLRNLYKETLYYIQEASQAA